MQKEISAWIIGILILVVCALIGTIRDKDETIQNIHDCEVQAVQDEGTLSTAVSNARDDLNSGGQDGYTQAQSDLDIGTVATDCLPTN